MTLADRFFVAHQTLAAHGVRLDGHDLTLEQAEAIVLIVNGDVDPAVILAARKTLKAVV